MRRQKKIGRVVLLYGVLAIIMTLPLSFHLKSIIPSDLGDPLYSVWVLDWEIHSLKSGFKDFWNGNIFYPHRRTLLYADYYPGLVLLAFPLLTLTNHLILTYNLLFLLSFILSALAMYLLMRHLCRSSTAAFIAGLVFAFCPYRMAHISHLELLFSPWIPLSFLFLLRFFDNPSFANLAGIGLFYVLQALSCAYYGVYSSLFIGLFIFYFSYKKGFIWQKDFWFKVALLAVIVFSILFPLFYPYIPAHSELDLHRLLPEAEHYSVQFQHFLQAPPWNNVWGRRLAGPSSPEWQRYPGVVALLLSIFWLVGRVGERQKELRVEKTRLFFWWDTLTGFYLLGLVHVAYSGGFTLRWGETKILSVHRLANPLLILCISLILRFWLGWRRSKKLQPREISTFSLAPRFFLFSCAFALLLALGPTIRLLDKPILTGPYYFFYQWIPVFRGLRAPSRFFLFVMISLALFSGWAMEKILKKQKTRFMKRAIPVLVSSLILVDYASLPMPTAKLPWAKKFPSIYSHIQQLPPQTVLLELPMPVEQLERGREALPMFYSTFHRKKLVNGYSGYVPPGYAIIYEAMEDFPSSECFRLLEDLGVDYVLLHTQGYRPEKAASIFARMDAFPHRAELEASADGDYLYRLIPRQEEHIEPKDYIEVGNPSLWTAWASSNVTDCELAFDGNPATGWTSRFPQRPGDFFFLDLREMAIVEKLELSLSGKPLDYPRGFTVEGSVDQKNWFSLDEIPFFIPRLTKENIEELAAYAVFVSFEPRPVRFLRIRLTRSHPDRPWSIQEIRCFRRSPLS